MSDPVASVTTLLKKVAGGDVAAEDELFRRVEMELRRIARKYMHYERPDHALQSTILVDDAFLRILRGRSKESWQNRRDFFHAASRAMRQILIEYARKRTARKRGAGQQPLCLDNLDEFPAAEAPQDFIYLDDALQKLATVDPRAEEVVCLRFFWGYTIEETASLLDVSTKTVNKDWNHARAFLVGEIADAYHDA